MKGSQKVIDQLNKLLVCELTAIDVYFIHSRLYEDWGVTKLYERINHEMDDEKLHADKLIKRILFLEGMPDLSVRYDYKVGSSIKELIEQELKLEMDNCKLLKETIKIAEAEFDYETRNTCLELLKDTEEDHIDWMETQLGLIEKIGIERYTQSMM